jgi:hypothetical protein
MELRSLPWQQAAQRLIAFLETTDDTQRALAVLNLLCRRFGDHGYPGFLKLLLIIGNSAATLAKQRLSDAIALGLQRGNVPSGVLSSWGATRLWTSQQRQLDPLAYLTVWFCQRTHRPFLSESAYHGCVVTLLELFNYSRAARELYPLKIAADLTGIEGAFSRQTRRRLGALAESWQRDLSVERVAAAAVEVPTHSGEP